MMRPIPITIAAVFLFAIGVASIAGLVVPQTRMYLHPHWAVALASTNLLATATGFWFMRRWAPFVFFAIWGIQYALLVQIDVATPQVFVKGMVYEVTTGQKEGGAFGLAVNILQGKFGLAIGKTASVGDLISFKNAGIEAVFSALNTDSRFKSVSNPSLRVQSGASARFSVGSDVCRCLVLYRWIATAILFSLSSISPAG